MRREIHDGLNVVEQWNGATDFVFFARRGEMASNRREDHEISMLALHLIQNCMVYINIDDSETTGAAALAREADTPRLRCAEPADLGTRESVWPIRSRHEYAIGVAVIEMAPGNTTVGSTPRSEAEKRAYKKSPPVVYCSQERVSPMNRLNNTFGRNAVRLLGVLFLVSLLTPRHFASGETVRFVGDSYLIGDVGRWTKAVAEEWAKKTNNTVEYIGRPADATATLQLYLQYWGSKSGDLDVYMVDVIWQGIAAPHAVDLKKYVKDDEIKEFFPRSVENNTVNGRLVSIPWFIDAGLLYYRTDLLEKYGYKAPPQTWEELADMARKIQDGERAAGNPDFQGFVFEGKASESVTCNAVEWIYSYGGGTVIDPDKNVTINNPNAIKALETARSWVGTISPTNVTTYGEEEARNIWQAGNAAFMRNWPYAYRLSADPKSPISGKFDVTVLPKGGDNGENAACLGGWQLMVSAYSKVPNASADLVRYLTSSEIQKKHAIDLGLLPTLHALYSDPDLVGKIPWFKNVPDVLTNAVARPSTVTGAYYNQVSSGLFENVNKVLSGEESAKDAVFQIERVAKRIVP